jgi:hypothetical protein
MIQRRIQTYSFFEKAYIRNEKNPCTRGHGTEQKIFVVDILTACSNDAGENHACFEGHWGGANESLRVLIV